MIPQVLMHFGMCVTVTLVNAEWWEDHERILFVLVSLCLVGNCNYMADDAITQCGIALPESPF